MRRIEAGWLLGRVVGDPPAEQQILSAPQPRAGLCMRKEYRKAVRELFTRGMQSRLPQFEPTRVNAPILFNGETVFCWEASNRLHCFVLLVPNSRGHQSFTVELGWSHAARFPDVSSKPTLMLGAGDPNPVDVSEGIVRLGAIVSRNDVWWELPDPALQQPADLAALQESIKPISTSVARQRASGPVEACLVALEGDGVDFFRSLASREK